MFARHLTLKADFVFSFRTARKPVSGTDFGFPAENRRKATQLIVHELWDDGRRALVRRSLARRRTRSSSESFFEKSKTAFALTFAVLAAFAFNPLSALSALCG